MSDQSGNTGSNQDQDGENKGSGKEQQGQNNGQNNDDNLDDLWQDPEDKSGEDTTPGQKTQQQQQPQQTQDDPHKIFNAHVAGLKLTEGVDLEKISGDLNSGNTESLDAALKKMAANVYRQSMIDASKIIDKKVEEGVNKAILQSKNAVQGGMAIDKMQASLQFTKDPVLSPVATAVLSQLIKKGKSVDDAIIGVRKFFEKTANLSGKELGSRNPPRSRPGSQQFNNNIQDDDEAAEIDWMDTLNV